MSDEDEQDQDDESPGELSTGGDEDLDNQFHDQSPQDFPPEPQPTPDLSDLIRQGTAQGKIDILEAAVAELQRELEEAKKRLGDVWPPTIAPDSTAGSTVILVKIISSASGGGKYNGRSLAAPLAAATPTGDLAQTDLGAVVAANDVLMLNIREVGKSTHDVEASAFLPLIFLCLNIGTSSDGRTLVAFDGLQWEDCTT